MSYDLDRTAIGRKAHDIRHHLPKNQYFGWSGWLNYSAWLTFCSLSVGRILDSFNGLGFCSRETSHEIGKPRQFKRSGFLSFFVTFTTILLFVSYFGLRSTREFELQRASTLQRFSNIKPYRPCLIQLYGNSKLRNGTSVSAAGARLSMLLSGRYASAQKADYHLYDCMGRGMCGKAGSIFDSCYKQQCTHVLYIDADVFLHESQVDLIGHTKDTYPEATVMTGIDYYRTMMNPKWHNGEIRQ